MRSAALLTLATALLAGGAGGAVAPPAPACRMPPHPGGEVRDLRRLEREGRISVPHVDRAFFARHGLARAPGGLPRAERMNPPWLGTSHFPVLLVQFSDNPFAASYVGGVASYFQSLLFGTSNPAGQPWTMRNFYFDNSYGNLVMLGTVYGPYVLPQPYAYYTAGAFGFGAYPMNAQKLTEDAIAAHQAANPGFSWAPYDNDANMQVDAVAVVHAGIGAEASGNTGHVWSHFWVTNGPVNLGGGYTALAYYQGPEYENFVSDLVVGVHAHEMGHALGMPDLYDGACPAGGVGAWSNMAQGTWLGFPPGARPAYLDPWDQVSRGWVSPVAPASNQTCAFVPVKEAPLPGMAVTPVVYKLSTPAFPSTEYFLVEARAKVGWDEFLPGEGLLVWHVDETVGSNNFCAPLSCGNHPFNAVVEADGDYDMLKTSAGNFGDASDPFPGQSMNRDWDDPTTPNARRWCAGAASGVAAKTPVAHPLGVQVHLLVAPTTAALPLCAPPTMTATATPLPSPTAGGPSWTASATPTAAVTVTPYPCLFGYPFAGSGATAVGARLHASGFSLLYPASFNLVQVYTNVSGALVHAAVYADAGGVPGGLIAQTAIGISMPGGWTSLLLPPTALGPADYWLAFESDNANANVFRRDNAQPGGSPNLGTAAVSWTFGPSFPPSFPAVSAVNVSRVFSVFAVCVGYSTPTPTYSTFTSTATASHTFTPSPTPVSPVRIFPNPVASGGVLALTGLDPCRSLRVGLYNLAGETVLELRVEKTSGDCAAAPPIGLRVVLRSSDGAPLRTGVYLAVVRDDRGAILVRRPIALTPRSPGPGSARS